MASLRKRFICKIEVAAKFCQRGSFVNFGEKEVGKGLARDRPSALEQDASKHRQSRRTLRKLNRNTMKADASVAKKANVEPALGRRGRSFSRAHLTGTYGTSTGGPSSSRRTAMKSAISPGPVT